MIAGPDNEAVDRYLALLRELRALEEAGDHTLAERRRRRAEAEFFVMDDVTSVAAARAARAEGLDL